MTTIQGDRRDYKKAYRLAHREEINQKSKAYRLAHREEIKQRNKAYALTHPEKIKHLRSAYALTHREQLNQKNKAYALTHREKVSINTHRYRSRKAGLPATLTSSEWESIKAAYHFRCAYCGRKPSRLAREHVIPVSKGGGTIKENIVPACKSCNSRKNDKLPSQPIKLVLL